MSYNQLAKFYDRLTFNAEYEKRTEYLLEIFRMHNAMPAVLVDLACGTGNFSIPVYNRGIDVIAVDISADMLSIAKHKADEQGNDIFFLCQDICNLDLQGRVDGAICCLDSLNHILDLKRLKSALSRISLFLEQGSLFIFDVNTEYKFEKILSDNIFIYDLDDIYCIWQSKYNPKTRKVLHSLDIFSAEGDLYTRHYDEIEERMYSRQELEDALNASGFEIVDIYDDLSFEKPGAFSERNTYVCRKK